MTDECQCPKCGRLHRHLGAGKPPPLKHEAEITRAEAIYANRLRAEVIEDQRRALLDCQTMGPSVMTNDQAIERLKAINAHVYKVLGLKEEARKR